MRSGRQHNAWWYLAFPLTIVVLFTALPSIAGVALSFFEWSGGGSPRFVGLENYRALFAAGPFWPALRNTLLFALITVPITTGGAFLAAAALNAEWFCGRTLVRTILFVPTIISIVAIGFIWRWVLDPSPGGLLNTALASLGVDRGALPDWLGRSPWALATIILVSIWRGLGFAVVLYLAALGGVSRSLYDAAAVDGATPWQTLRHITWPSVRPMTFFLLITGMIGALQVFDIVLVMIGTSAQGWADVLNLYLYREFTLNRLGYASTIGVVILILTIFITALQWRAMAGRAEAST